MKLLLLTKPRKLFCCCNNGGQHEAVTVVVAVVVADIAVGIHRAVGGREAGGLPQDVRNGHSWVSHADSTNENTYRVHTDISSGSGCSFV